MLNQTIIVGRITSDPTLNKTESDKNIMTIILAVPRSYKNVDGTYDTDFIPCILWNNIASNTAEYCKKGDLIGVKGRLQSREVQIENTKISMLEMVAEKVTFLSTAHAEKNKKDSVCDSPEDEDE